MKGFMSKTTAKAQQMDMKSHDVTTHRRRADRKGAL